MHRRVFIKRPRFSVGGTSFVDQDESSNHSGVNILDYDDDSLSQLSDRPRRVARPQGKTQPDDRINLNACLDYLLRNLSRKDKEGFFQYPVTDQFAPGYSQIILRPMDFSTMKRKITHDEYSNILEFRSDFELMCDNAMKYNRPDTIYWQAAKKLLAFGSKLMHKDKLISYRRTVECFAHLTERDLGFRVDSSSNSNLDDSLSHLNDSLDPSNTDSEQLSSISISQACSQRKPKLILKLPKIYSNPSTVAPTTATTTPVAVAAAAVISIPTTTSTVEEEEMDESSALVDDISPEELLLRVQQASQMAREKFQQRQPIFSYTVGYSRRHAQSLLRLVNQDDLSEQTIPLMDNNHLSLPTTDSEKEQYNTIREFLDHGPFSSQPTSQNDSPLASLPKEELDLLIHTYGSEFSAQYAMSLMDFIKDAGELALVYVDRLLSVLTNGEHDNYVLKKREKPTIKEEPQLTEAPSNTSVPSIKVEPEIPNNEQEEESIAKIDSNPNESISTGESTTLPDYDFPDLPDLSQLTDGTEQMISNENPSTFDSF